MESVQIEYFGHACFRLSFAGQRIVLDPYADGSVEGYAPLRLDAEFVYCSHGHGDHSAVGNVSVSGRMAPAFGLTELESDHDDAGGTKRGKSMIRIFDFDGLRVAHLGDLGRALNETEAAALSGVDCLLVPVGGFYTIDAATAAALAAQVAPRTVIPMHYRTAEAGLPVIASLDEAMETLEKTGLNIIALPFGGSAQLN
ncbi:MAG: Zn-dependent hydrolase [Ruminococcaceae bacterium]|nr:Zn-dependent hydrolase [Oscillospiraceae bacterium]